MAASLDQSRIAGMGNVFRAEVRHGMRMPFVRPTCATSSRSERRDPTEMRYRLGADGPLGRRSRCWCGRCRSSCPRLGVLGHDVGDTPARSLTGRRPPSAVEMFMSSLLGGLHAPR